MSKAMGKNEVNAFYQKWQNNQVKSTLFPG